MNPYAAAVVAPYQEAVARVARSGIENGCAPRDLCAHLAYALAVEVSRHLSEEGDPRGLREAADALVSAEHAVTQRASDVGAIVRQPGGGARTRR